ncbi:hypothetical protein V6N11_074372 [Hibiscus sabdariffa]|uniref:Uncharacterized protein n=1 Tax=Hibiscus sabdariffa TaxID=183260 RepID=A0ABR2R3I1_9ROSI
MFFGVFRAANFIVAGCGGALRFEGGHIRALFSDPVSNYGADFSNSLCSKGGADLARISFDKALVMVGLL